MSGAAIKEQGPKTLAAVQERIEAAKAREALALLTGKPADATLPESGVRVIAPLVADVENDGDRGPRPSRDPLASIDGQDARPCGLTWGAWRPPPRKRANVTATARLPGAGKIHLTIDLDANGQPCAVWVEVHKEGSIVRGMLDCVAALASQALQHGALIQEVAARMIGVRFEPDGPVEGHDTIAMCTSIVDLIGQMLLAEFSDGTVRP